MLSSFSYHQLTQVTLQIHPNHVHAHPSYRTKMPADPYARLLNLMMPFHNRFRLTYATIQGTLKNPQIQALPHRQLTTLLHQTLALAQHLDGHHQIEEAYIFPQLAVRMPQFGKGHIEEHETMHRSLVELRNYARTVERTLTGSQGRKAMNDGAGQALPSSSGDEEGEDGERKRKEWPTAIFDSGRFQRLVDELGAALFPHLEAEETSLRPSNMKAAGFTPEELNSIPV
ncbi:hypothetical protein CF319_g4251 [Tilletia indica]|nr:hypothetical protein CF319_g4251 [Tilletia indica]KAE8229063.1 hypothetical protein CF326_g5979 [Tilletia indica]